MISFLQGKIIFKKEKFVVLDVAGVGYKVFLSKKTYGQIPAEGDNLKLFCFLNVRENLLDLYGFLNYEELEFFELLDTISGVGPKAALEISSLGPLEKIKKEILAHDSEIFAKIPGIGPKKAQTIILELSGRIEEITKEKIKITKIPDEAEEALVNLGFSRQRAKEALSQIPKEAEVTEQRVKAALKILGK